MRPRPPQVPHEENWQQVAADIDMLLREMVDDSGSPMSQRELTLRVVRGKLDNLKLRLETLKQRLLQHLQRMEERLLVDRSDLEARYLAAVGAEHLADLWLMESLLERLAKPADGKSKLTASFTYELPSTRSGEVGGSM